MKHTETKINSDTAWRDGFSAALQWICTGGPNPTNTGQLKAFDEKVIDAIHRTIKEDFGHEPQDIYLDSRKREIVMLRVYSWEAYQMCTGASMEQTMRAFGGLRTHSTFANAKKNIIGSLDYFPSGKSDFHRFLYGVQTRLDLATKDDRAQYVDLGLPSGLLWSDRNILGYHDDSILQFDSISGRVPRRENFEELVRECEHHWSDELNGVYFVGRNGNSVLFPALGSVCVKGIRANGVFGFYLINKTETEKENIFRFNYSLDTSFAFVDMVLKTRYVSVRTISKLQ